MVTFFRMICDPFKYNYKAIVCNVDSQISGVNDENIVGVCILCDR